MPKKKIIRSPKKNQSPNSPSRVKPAILALFLIVLLLAISQIFKFFIWFGSPEDQALIGPYKYAWSGKTSINIALVGKDISLLNFDPVTKKATLLTIPDQTYIDVPRGFKTWSLGSVYNLGQEENPPIGGVLIKDSLKSLTGLPIDYVLILDQKSPKTGQQILSNWHDNLTAIFDIFSAYKTDLTPSQYLSLIRQTSSLRSDKLKTIDLYDSDITKSTLLPDSSRVLGVDKIRLDLFIRDNLYDEQVSKENLSVAIYNATDIPGLANDLSRLITNLGGNVTFVSNAEEVQPETSVIFDHSDPTIAKTATFDRLVALLSSKCQNGKCLSSDPRVTESRAQITVVLGQDYYHRYFERTALVK